MVLFNAYIFWGDCYVAIDKWKIPYPGTWSFNIVNSIFFNIERYFSRVLHMVLVPLKLNSFLFTGWMINWMTGSF